MTKMPKKLYEFLSRCDERTAWEIDSWLVEDSNKAFDEMRDVLADAFPTDTEVDDAFEQQGDR